MSQPLLPRRDFLALAATAVTGAAVAGLTGACARPASSPGPSIANSSARSHRDAHTALKLGVASYSLRNFPRDKAIAMVQALRTPYVNLKSVHLPYESALAELVAARHEIESAGLTIVGGGTITFDKDNDTDVARYFDYARAAGMPLIVATMNPAILPRVERCAMRYDIRVAIHNHGPEDPHFPSPYDVLKAVRSIDPRVGLCIDIGHTARTGTDVVQSVADAGPRLLDMHAKDLRDLTNAESQCIVGEGAMPVAAILRQLVAMNYAGCVNLEYEIDADDPLPGMKQSMAFMRGVLAAIAG